MIGTSIGFTHVIASKHRMGKPAAYPLPAVDRCTRYMPERSSFCLCCHLFVSIVHSVLHYSTGCSGNFNHFQNYFHTVDFQKLWGIYTSWKLQKFQNFICFSSAVTSELSRDHCITLMASFSKSRLKTNFLKNCPWHSYEKKTARFYSSSLRKWRVLVLVWEI